MGDRLKRSYAYLRVSGQWQLSGHGFDRQLDQIKEYCRKNRYTLEGIFEEQVSGTGDDSDRPKWQEMVASAIENEVKTILVESLDRLAREYVIQEQLLIYLASKNIDLVIANTGENLTRAMVDDPMKKALVQMQGIFAELDKSLLVKELRHARDRVRKEKGRCEGQKPYGYTQEEKEILKEARYMRRKTWKEPKQRRTYREIAENLNERGVKTRQGREWTTSSVYNIPNRK